MESQKRHKMSIFLKRQAKDLIRDITSLGSLSFYLITSLIFLLLNNYTIFRKLAIGLVLIYVVVIPIRTFYFKHRPEKYEYKSYIERLDASSFPSLHAARTAYMCLTLIEFFNENLISLIIVIVSLAVFYSRIHLKKHDILDISGGAIVGGLIYFLVSYIGH